MLGLCLALMLVQFLAAVPWLLAWTGQSAMPTGTQKTAAGRPRPLTALAIALGGALGAGLLFALLHEGSRAKDALEGIGKGYGSVLQLQLQADLIVLVFSAMHWLWPKGAAVARAAFREGYRQPMFWLANGLAGMLILLSPYVPYFTFGEDYIIVKEVGFDTIMLAATVFGVIAAAMSISYEIEDRTAVTLMSKPVSRRQFLLGKFAGIFLCSFMMVSIGGWVFDHVLLYKRWFDKMDPLVLTPDLSGWLESLSLSAEGNDLMRGSLLWLTHTGEVLPGLLMASSQIMVMVAVAVSLATRLPMIVNLVCCLIVYLLANLTPILVISTRIDAPGKSTTVGKLLHFTAQVFDTFLPNLELFRVRPSLVDEANLPMDQYLQHVAGVSLYGVLFTAIVLLVGLVLFEDRDLA